MKSTLDIAYKILYGLEHKKRNQAAAEVISPSILKADPDKWIDVLETLSDEGYISGVSITEDVTGETEVEYAHAKITLQGAQYLKENSAMQKIARAMGHVIQAASSLIQ